MEFSAEARLILQCIAQGKGYSRSISLGQDYPVSAAEFAFILMYPQKAARMCGIRLPQLPEVLQLEGLSFDEHVNMEGASIPFVLYFKNCRFNKGLSLCKSRIRSLHLDGCIFKNTLCLTSSSVSQDLNAFNTEFRDSEADSIPRFCHIPGIDCLPAFIARDLEVSGSCVVRECKFHGEAYFAGAEIKGALDLGQTEFAAGSRMSEYAFRGSNIEIGGSLYLDEVKVPSHTVSFEGAIIGGSIRGRSANFGEVRLKDALVKGAVLFDDSTFVGKVDFSDALFESSVEFKKCHIKKEITFYTSRVSEDLRIGESTQCVEERINSADSRVYLVGVHVEGSLVLTGGEFYIPIEANNITVGKDLFMNKDRGSDTGFVAHSYIRLDSAHIGGNLDARGGKIRYKGKTDDVNFYSYRRVEDHALYAALITVKGNVFLGAYDSGNRFECEGPVNLTASRIGGNLDCRGGKFLHEGERCFYASLMEVERSVLLGAIAEEEKPESTFKGGIRLRGAHIRGVLNLGGAQVEAQKSRYSLEAQSIKVDLDILLCINPETGYKPPSFKKTVRLDKAIVLGNLDCGGGQFGHALDKTQNNQGASRELWRPYDYCLYAVGIQASSIYLGVPGSEGGEPPTSQHAASKPKQGKKTEQKRKMKAAHFFGPVNFALAKVSNRFDCRGGIFDDTSERCLYAPQIEVGRRIFLGQRQRPDLYQLRGQSS